jgi:exodeoxyribonuclease VII small subunit
MSDERSTFEMTRARLEDIVTQARRKDVSLEQSLDLLEEAVRLVNQCNELIDQTSFRAPGPDGEAEGQADTGGDGDETPVVVVTDLVEAFDTDGDGVVDALVETVVVSEDAGTDDERADETALPDEEEDDARE